MLNWFKKKDKEISTNITDGESGCKYLFLGYEGLTDQQKEDYHKMIEEEDNLNKKYKQFVDELIEYNEGCYPKQETKVTSTDAKLIRRLILLEDRVKELEVLNE